MRSGIRRGLKDLFMDAANAVRVTIFFDTLILRTQEALVRGEASKCSKHQKNAIQAIILSSFCAVFWRDHSFGI